MFPVHGMMFFARLHVEYVHQTWILERIKTRLTASPPLDRTQPGHFDTLSQTTLPSSTRRQPSYPTRLPRSFVPALQSSRDVEAEVASSGLTVWQEA
jgi:phenylpropionate dioxygenase-like ring-hydroxylating dioxygenase large terminal subunit